MFLARCVDVFVKDRFMFVSFRLNAKENLPRSGEYLIDILTTSNGASALTMF